MTARPIHDLPLAEAIDVAGQAAAEGEPSAEEAALLALAAALDRHVAEDEGSLSDALERIRTLARSDPEADRGLVWEQAIANLHGILEGLPAAATDHVRGAAEDVMGDWDPPVHRDTEAEMLGRPKGEWYYVAGPS